MTKLSIRSLGSIRRLVTPHSLAPDTVIHVITWREAEIVSLDRSWAGCSEATVALKNPLPDGREECKALAFIHLVGNPRAGDRVLLNVSALSRGLGTGGFALIVAIPDRLPADPVPGPGHLVKARYTPLQAMVLGVDEQESDHHGIFETADDLNSMPVVVADLHSSLPAILAGIRHRSEVLGRVAPRVAYVMTDGAALPLWFSRTVGELKSAQWLAGTVTVGQSFGGDLEAVTVHTGLLAAQAVLGADIAVVTQGPGNLGTGTRWGYSGVAAGESLNAVAALRGQPIGALRISGADSRQRHLGVSHHSTTAYGRVALAPADIVVPQLTVNDVRIVGEEPGSADHLLATIVDHMAKFFTEVPQHRRVDVPTDGLRKALEKSPAALSTMGRGLDADPAGFIAAAAAGVHAQNCLNP